MVNIQTPYTDLWGEQIHQTWTHSPDNSANRTKILAASACRNNATLQTGQVEATATEKHTQFCGRQVNPPPA
jgi:hypothetical protein